MKEIVLSVGIDIGTSTTQLVFSEICIENMASMVSVPRLQIMEKRLVYTSEIHYTPLLSAKEIDGEKIRSLVELEYQKAGIATEQVQTGAVIITGETARKDNAARVLENLSGLAGDFVVATAGPALEGIIAGKGAQAHLESKNRGAVVANLDIGGGTTNIAVFKNGEILDTCCLDIGGRLLRFADSSATLEYASTKIKLLAERLGLPLSIGQRPHDSTLTSLAAAMAEILEQAIGIGAKSTLLKEMATDKLLRLNYPIDYVTFSGGVADCIAKASTAEPFAYNDLGPYLGKAIAESEIPRVKTILQAKETIRATVVGAGSHTTDISGSTVSFSDNWLPLQNVPILKLTPEDEKRPFAAWSEIIAQKLQWFDLKEGKQAPALAFKGPQRIGFDEIQELAAALTKGMATVLSQPVPLIVVIENDLAKALGQALQALTGPLQPIICLDTIKVENGDYIDIGKGIGNGKVVPVIVKTLVFGY